MVIFLKINSCHWTCWHQMFGKNTAQLLFQQGITLCSHNMAFLIFLLSELLFLYQQSRTLSVCMSSGKWMRRDAKSSFYSLPSLPQALCFALLNCGKIIVKDKNGVRRGEGWGKKETHYPKPDSLHFPGTDLGWGSALYFYSFPVVTSICNTAAWYVKRATNKVLWVFA